MNSTSKPAVQFPLISVERTRALVSLETVMSVLVDFDEDQILSLIFDHFNLGPAFNIASQNARNRELRVLMQYVKEFKLSGGQSKPKRMVSEAIWLPMILQTVSGLNNDKPFFSGGEVQQLLNCKATHVINLLEEGSLALLPNTPRWRPGKGGSPVISRDSLVTFLKKRQEI